MKKVAFSVISAVFCVFSFCAFASGTQDSSALPNAIAPNGENPSAPTDGNAEEANAPLLVSEPVPSAVEIIKASFDESVRAKRYEEALALWKNAESEAQNGGSEKDGEIVLNMKSAMDAFFSSMSFTVVNTPSEVTNGKAFKTPFTVKLTSTAEGFTANAFTVLVEYPSIDENGNKSTAFVTVTPAEDGTVSFTAPQTSFAHNGFVSFSLSLSAAAGESFTDLPTARIPYRVQTNMKGSGGSIAIVDFTKAGKAITTNSETSSAVLTALINKGFTRIGNSDFTASVAAKNDDAVQREAAALFQKSVTYLVYGTVKYEKSEKTENGYCTSLVCELKVRNVLKNKELLSQTLRAEATEKTEWASLNSARKKLASDAASVILYGM